MRPGRSDRAISSNTVVGYVMVLKDLYRQRAKLRDAILTDPLPEETTLEAAGLTPETRGAISFIPDAIAITLLNAALKWVENHGPTIVEAETIRLKARAVGFDRGGKQKLAQYYANRELKRASLTGPSGEPLSNSYAVRHAVCRLVTACYILIAGFVGMRASEILSMQVGAIEYHRIGETGVVQAYILARLFKTSDEIGGRLERWLAPAPIVKSVDLLEQLNVLLREATGRCELFMAKNTQRGEIAPVSNTYMNLRINEFARHVDIPLHDGKPWVFSSHQFRKTFARFIAQRDRSHLLGLAEHFKHVSIAMTARGYVGSDFDLHQLIDEEAQAETAVALDRILASDRLAGRMGERIVAGNARFRGRAGEQVRRDYIEFVLEKTDLRVYACDYGWCVFQPETARCGGERAPNEAGRSPAVCLSCANMVIDARHAPYWRDRRERNAALMPRAPIMTAAVLAEAVEQCDQVLAKIERPDEQV